uniref:Putative secreted protein n=1 Tax=Ixodes ricinus TaxID=34613 RepID=A0A6B0U8N2_IXORI
MALKRIALYDWFLFVSLVSTGCGNTSRIGCAQARQHRSHVGISKHTKLDDVTPNSKSRRHTAQSQVTNLWNRSNGLDSTRCPQ